MLDNFIPYTTNSISKAVSARQQNRTISTIDGVTGEFVPEDAISFVDTKPVLDPFNNRLFIKAY